MAAAQCRSSKCTAERKGFRRELDSWRHKLIHCIGFESILEGIYGPMLLRDLNIFDDCEPEDVDDWSVEASCSHCSFCNLPLDKLSDHGPAAASPLSSPSDYSPCQALTISDSSQSAHRFLQAVFHKKDVSLSCDSNIPLVAQELMKKMIHKFAIEYASKSHDHSPTNGLTTGNTSPLSDADDLDAPLDGPLDLTLSREKEKDGEPQPDGVLDLSKRNSACSATSLSANHKPSGFLLPTIKEEAVDPGRQQEKCGQVNGKSALEAVLNSLCPVHRSLLCQILKLAHRERLLSSSHCRPICPADSKCCNRSVTPQDNISQFPFYNCKSHSSSPHFPLANCDNQDHSNTPSHQADSQYNCCGDRCPLGDCKSKASEGSGCCCVQNCRVTAYPVFCLKNLHGICQSLAVHQINNVVCPFSSAPSLSSSSPMCSASSICYSHHSRPHPCLCYSNQAYFAQIGHTGEKGGENGDLPFPFLKREQSPSPPPLSPIPSAVSTETEEKPPCLLLHTQEDDHDLFLPLIGKDGVMHVKQQEVDFDTTRGVYFSQEELEGTPGGCCTENNPSGSLLKVVVDRFTEKLETIRPQDKDPPPRSTAIDSIEKEGSQTSATNQNTQFHADAHLREIITTVLHTGCDSDYNLSELFNQHDNSEAKSPNTRARRLQEVRAAMTTSLDHPSNRRHTLQIKRELAMLDPSYCRKRVPQAKKLRLKDGSKLTPPASSSSSDTTPVKEESQSGTKIQEELEEFKRKGVSSIHEEIIMKRMIDGEESTTEVERTTARGCRKISEDPNMDKGVEVFERAREEVCNLLNEEGGRGKVKEEIQAIIVTEEIEAVKVEERETKMAIEEKERNAPSTRELELLSNSCEINLMENGLSNSGDLEKGADGNHKGFRGRTKTSALFQSSNSREATRSKRNIVPPQRFSSYVTEPRKMYFVACFSESIFNPRTSKGDLSNSSSLNDFSKSPDVMDTQVESEKEKSFSKDIMGEHIQSTPKHQTGPLNTESKDQNRVSPMTMTAVKKSPSKPSSKNRTDVRDSAARPYGRLRSSAKLQNSDFATTYHTPPNRSKSCASISNISSNCLLSPSDCSFQYNSPIKLMYVSPVTDQEGVKYSLKSATSDSRGQVVEQFDPYEESSWAGTPEKNTSPGSECATSPVKSVSSPPKFTISSPKSTSTVHKSDSSPPKSASSSPKVASRRSRESSPSKRIAGTENQRSPGDVVQFHETTPTKRRPGRPKKLGPQMEKKIKRPIGRPRKQKVPDSIKGANAEKVKAVIGANREKENKNLKITVVYGRSRRNKRVVSEGHGQTELNDTAEAADGNIDLNYVLQDTQEASDDVKATLTERSEELNLVRPVKDKESTPHSSSNIKCQKLQGALAVRKPGRPAKVKISGISVTVTTVSPRQRKIQMNRDVKQSPEALRKKKALLPEFKSAKEPWTINLKTSNEYSKMERLGAKDERRGKERPLAVRHSVRIRKPSIYLLHSVATSSTRPYSHSTALLRSSRQLLLNKAINQRKQEKAQGYVDGTKDKRQLLEQEKKHICQDLSQLAGVSVDSIFPHKETLKWWAASAEENHLNQELARRIRVISDTWVSNVVDNREESSVKQRAGSFSQKSRPSSVVRALFDCPPNKPSSCSMQQICSWFMQTTETQSLAIVKKTSSRNPYELMHYPRSANKSSVCPSPQAERLHKHIKKFAKAVPKSPSEHRRAQDRLSKRDKAGHIKRQLFPNKFAPGRFTQGTRWWRVFSKYSTTLLRAKVRFLTLKERDKWPKRQWKNLWRSKRLFDACGLNGYVVAAPQQSDNLLSRSSPDQSSDYLENDSTAVSAERLDMHKEDRLSCKAWSPEKLKECRVFLKKINSPDSESTAEEWDSCTVTLDDWSPSAYRFAGRERAPAREDKAVKTERKKKSRKRDASGGVVGCALASPQDQDKVPPQRHKRKLKCSGMASSEPPKPPSVKMLRQSRMRGLSGPRWSDFVFEN